MWLKENRRQLFQLLANIGGQMSAFSHKCTQKKLHNVRILARRLNVHTRAVGFPLFQVSPSCCREEVTA